MGSAASLRNNGYSRTDLQIQRWWRERQDNDETLEQVNEQVVQPNVNHQVLLHTPRSAPRRMRCPGCNEISNDQYERYSGEICVCNCGYQSRHIRIDFMTPSLGNESEENTPNILTRPIYLVCINCHSSRQESENQDISSRSICQCFSPLMRTVAGGSRVKQLKPKCLSATEIDELPVCTYTESTEVVEAEASDNHVARPYSDISCQCSICLVDYNTDESLRVLPCKHRFHKSCVDPWLALNVTCPRCNMDVNHYSVLVNPKELQVVLVSSRSVDL